jgi:hypothetical protein
VTRVGSAHRSARLGRGNGGLLALGSAAGCLVDAEQVEQAAAPHLDQPAGTKNGRSYLVLMSAEDLESIEVTLELLSRSGR